MEDPDALEFAFFIQIVVTTAGRLDREAKRQLIRTILIEPVRKKIPRADVTILPLGGTTIPVVSSQ